MYKAVIFDFDGLILDTETSMVEAWQVVYGRYDTEFPVHLWRENIAAEDHFDPHAYLQTAVGRLIDRETLYQEARAIDAETLSQRGTMPGVREWIAEAKALNLRLAIASSSAANWLNKHLPRLGLLFEFEAVRTSTDVGGVRKPRPDVYLAACEAIRVDPAEAIALEDSKNGIASAKAAGMTAVAIPNAVTRPMDFSAADLIISSLAEVSVAEVLDRLKKKD